MGMEKEDTHFATAYSHFYDAGAKGWSSFPVLECAEMIPFEPDRDNARVGKPQIIKNPDKTTVSSLDRNVAVMPHSFSVRGRVFRLSFYHIDTYCGLCLFLFE